MPIFKAPVQEHDPVTDAVDLLAGDCDLDFWHDIIPLSTGIYIFLRPGRSVLKNVHIPGFVKTGGKA